MDLFKYRQQRQNLIEQAPKYRQLCSTCIQPEFSCYCPHVQKFHPGVEFAILIHPIEVRRRIATGRMSHLCLEGSHLIAGQNYTHNDQVNSLIEDKNKQCVMLYPRGQSTNLSPLNFQERSEIFDPNKKLVIFVIDGTWATARKMVRQSQNLFSLPRICFTPEKPSSFRVRKQPEAGFYSTIEAIHQVIELVGPHKGFSIESREHDKLLYVFDKMVERQLEFIHRARENPEFCHYRRERQKSIA